MASTQTSLAPQGNPAGQPASTPAATGAQTIRNNAATAQKCAPNNKTGKCGFCERDGYPILLLRYGVFPTYLEHAAASMKKLSGVKSLDSFSDKPLKRGQYTLRTLRQGFVHVWLGKPGVWQTYVVTDDGYLRQLPDPDDPDWKTERPLTPACRREGHNIPASFITIPDGYEQVWIAFAENAWCKKVRERYEKTPDERMQPCQVKALAQAPSTVRHAFDLGAADTRLESLAFDYVTDAGQYVARCGYTAVTWDALGQQQRRQGYDWKSLHGNIARAGHGLALKKYAEQFAAQRAKKGEHGKVAAFALYDAVGMVKELNGFTHDHVKWRADYCTTVARPLLISQAIVGLKKQVALAVEEAVKAQEKKAGTPDVVSHTYSTGTSPFYRESVTATSTQKQRIETKVKSSWSDMLKRYDEPGRVAFEERYGIQMEVFGNWIADSDADWERWARDKRWKKWFDDYDLAKLPDNVAAMCMCAPALAGGPQGEAGAKLWEQWLSQKKDSDHPTGYAQIYAAIVGGRKELLDTMLPAANEKNPKDTDLNEGDQLYDALKSVLSAKEVDAPEKFKRLMTEQVQQAAAHLVTAMEGALSHLEKKVADQVEPYVRRATQAGLKLYRNATATVLHMRMTVGQYTHLLDEVARKGQDVGKHLAEQTGRRARGILLGGVLMIEDKKIRDTVVDVTICTLENAQEVKKTIEAAVAKARTEVYAMAGQTAAAIRIGGATISREAIEILKPLEGKLKVLPGVAQQVGRSVLTKGLRVAGASGEPLLALGSLVLQGWALRDARREMDKTFGEKGGLEAKGAVLSATMGVIAASMELAGAGVKAFSVEATGKLLIKVGGAIAAISLFVDGAQAAFSSVRAFRQGDTGAGIAYGFGSAALLGAGFISGSLALSGTTGALTGGLLGIGPLGWVLLLIAAGVLLIWWASTLESTPMEIWLDRCYWGHGKRAEGKWSDAQFQEEVTDLNALVLGLGVEIKFNDDWMEVLGQTDFDTVMVKLTLPGFDEQESVYAWKLYVMDQYQLGRNELAMVGGKDAQVLPEFKPMPSTPAEDRSARIGAPQGRRYYDGKGSLVEEVSVPVNTRIFSRARIEVKYWPNRSDPNAWAERLVLVAD